MRAVLFLAAGLIGLPLAVFAQPPQQPDIPVVHYKAVPEWPKAPLGDKGFPSAWNYWQVTSIAVEKSGNILVTKHWEAKITDFGVSRAQTESKFTKNQGTGRWMAPEVSSGQPYSIKVCSYHLCSTSEHAGC